MTSSRPDGPRATGLPTRDPADDARAPDLPARDPADGPPGGSTMAGARPTTLASQLEPVRLALLAEAEERAAALIGEATARAAAIVADATAEADGAVERSRERAVAAAGARSRRDLDRERADANRRVLEARAALLGRLADAVAVAAPVLRDDPRYPALLDHLADLARSQLGPDAEIVPAPAGRGGLTARHGHRRVDYTLDALAARALDRLGDEVEQLWT